MTLKKYVFSSGGKIKPIPFLVLAAVFYTFVSYVYIRAFFKTGFLYTGHDLFFHLSRVEEIYQDIVHGYWIPDISLFTFGQIGHGVQFFYPWMAIYPFALLKLIIHDPIQSIYIGIGLVTLLTFALAHFSMYQFSHSRMQSVLFSVIYTLSMYRAANIFVRFDLGEFVAMSFLPLVFLGFYYSVFGNYKKWYYLAIGMTLLLYSHVLTFVIVFLILLFIVVVCIRAINRKWLRIKYLSVAASFALLMTSVFWLPFVEHYFNTTINKPKILDLFTHALKLNELIDRSLANTFWTPNLGLFLLIALLVGWAAFNKVNKIYVHVYLLGLLMFMLSTNYFPWKYIQNTPFKILQFPWRLTLLTSFFLAVYFSKLCMVTFKKHSAVLILLVVLPVLFYYPAAQSYLMGVQNQNGLTAHPSSEQLTGAHKLNLETYRHLFDSSWTTLDYFPSEAVPYSDDIVGHKLLVNGHLLEGQYKPTVKNGAAVFDLSMLDLNKNDEIDLPFLMYKNDQVKINDQVTDAQISERGTLKISAVSDDDHVIAISYESSFAEKLSLWLTGLSWAGLMILIFISRRTSKHLAS